MMSCANCFAGCDYSRKARPETVQRWPSNGRRWRGPLKMLLDYCKINRGHVESRVKKLFLITKPCYLIVIENKSGFVKNYCNLNSVKWIMPLWCWLGHVVSISIQNSTKDCIETIATRQSIAFISLMNVYIHSYILISLPQFAFHVGFAASVTQFLRTKPTWMLAFFFSNFTPW